MKNLYKKYGYLIFLFFVILSLFDMRFATVAIICMFAPVILAITGRGRYWCGNYCPRGNFYDNVISKISPNKKVPKFLKSTGFRVFMIFFIITNFSIGLYKNWGNLYGIGFVFYKIIVITTIVGIVLGLFSNSRTWCNFCPMGTLSYFVAKVKGRKVDLAVDSNCVGCGICNKACPMGITPKEYKNDLIENPDCIFCEKCAYKCPKKSIKVKTK
ncbi:4Fe-4S binding protein [Clostridioides mangenotii]|uniref:4Fe-4S binding protein n=1 Tax=Metaclostridioides mangenotii TaxID=1540 RepID=UPI002149C00D|nr:4Fe-4S binding protein [Clostridioides mangenotii]